jgi:hypothetical protein
MKKFFFISIFLLILLSVLMTGCMNDSNVNETNYGSGRIVSQNRSVEECTGINIRYAGNVYLSQGDVQSVRVEADDNIINNVKTYADDGILNVGLDEGNYSNVTVRIYVILKTIDNVTIQGAGNITAENSLVCDQVYCSINGAGDINLNGNANNLTCGINGAGNINALGFPVKTCNARINGTGSCTVNVSEDLDAAISGVGNIIYDGNPTQVKSKVSGVGKISRK